MFPKVGKVTNLINLVFDGALPVNKKVLHVTTQIMDSYFLMYHISLQRPGTNMWDRITPGFLREEHYSPSFHRLMLLGRPEKLRIIRE